MRPPSRSRWEALAALAQFARTVIGQARAVEVERARAAAVAEAERQQIEARQAGGEASCAVAGDAAGACSAGRHGGGATRLQAEAQEAAWCAWTHQSSTP